MKLPPSEYESDGPNLTPVIDVVFLLLIFFLVATRLDKEEKEREIPVVLPEVAEAQSLVASKDLIIDVTRDGKYRIRNKEFSAVQLQEYLHQQYEKNPHRKIRIYGDGESAWKYGVEVMGMCNKAKLDKYTVAALQVDEK
jgi:biopolymer transport protein ExbD